MSEIYLLADPKYTGRVSVPVLWDKKRKTIVSNESSEIIRMLNSAFDAFTNEHTDYYPADLRSEIDAVNELVYANVNNGVYRTGFATTQQAYEEAFRNVFAALDEMERRLSRQRYVAGARMTEADWRLFPTLVRFDAVYYSHFKCNLRRIVDYPQSVELSARSLPDARRRRDRQPRPHQAALLRQPAQGEPDRHRAARPRARLRRAARPRPVRELNPAVSRTHRIIAFTRVPGAAADRSKRGETAPFSGAFIAATLHRIRGTQRITHHRSVAASPCSASAMRARVPDVVSGGSASSGKNPCAAISRLGTAPPSGGIAARHRS